MSDPDYVHQETQRSTAPVRYASSLALSTYRLIVIQLQSQTDLDEEFARRLVMEEQQSQSDWENQLGYQPRRQNNPQRGGGGPGDGGSGGKDTMSELSEQFNKFTESASPHSLVVILLAKVLIGVNLSILGAIGQVRRK